MKLVRDSTIPVFTPSGKNRLVNMAFTVSVVVRPVLSSLRFL